METPTKENTLYLPIKQVYFDQIIAGTKKEEYREIKEGITANRYLLKDRNGKYVLNPNVTQPNKEYFIDDYNNGNFPFVPKPYKYLYIAVGYAKERDTALVEVDGFRFIPNMIRADLYAFWQIAFHLGEIIEVYRK
nr:MAG TPA: helix-turn-helix domain-containing protein [Caudoviricetes sp.]